MKAALIVLCSACFALSAHAQDKARYGQLPEAGRLASACGVQEMNYKVKLDSKQHGPLPIPEGKALVYFLHEAGSGTSNPVLYPTTKYAIDGAWAGANHGDSWFAVPVEPGEHHLCTNLQSSFVNQRVELAHLTVEAGKAYFFRTRLVMSRSVELLEFERVDSDEGAYVVSVFPMSVPTVKK